MSTSNEEIPHLFLLEALASSPYLIKVALAEARDPAAASAAQNDLAEVEAALSVLKVGGWREGEAAGRPPFVRRNLLLLHAQVPVLRAADGELPRRGDAPHDGVRVQLPAFGTRGRTSAART